MLPSDQGWHFRMREYRQRLAEKGIQQSMSGKGNCLDNAVMENFFGKLKTELVYPSKIRDEDHFIRHLREYLSYYNTKRIKVNLNGLSPVEYRTQTDCTA